MDIIMGVNDLNWKSLYMGLNKLPWIGSIRYIKVCKTSSYILETFIYVYS